MFFFEKKQPENCDYLAKCRFFLRFDSDSLVILTDLNIFQSFDARLLPKVSQPTKFSSTWPENCEAKAGQARWPGRPARYGQAGQGAIFSPCHPYPTDAEKIHLSNITKLRLSQINNWFNNTRRKHRKQIDELRAIG